MRKYTGKLSLRNLPDVPIPFAIATSRYGESVANIMLDLQNSRAAEAKTHEAKEFKWFITYIQADDPNTSDPETFAAMLAQESCVFLVASGFHWQGYEQLEHPPPQVMARFDERARLMCRDKTTVHEPVKSVDMEQVLEDWLQAHPHNQQLAVVAKVVLAQLVASRGEV